MYGGHGVAFELGINIGAFINKSYMFTPYCGARTVFGSKYNTNFLSELDSHYKLPDNYDYLPEALII